MPTQEALLRACLKYDALGHDVSSLVANVLHLDGKGDGKPCGKGFISKRAKCSKEASQRLAADLKAGDEGAKKRVAKGKESAQNRQELNRAVQRDKGKKSEPLTEELSHEIAKRKFKRDLDSGKLRHSSPEYSSRIKELVDKKHQLDLKKQVDTSDWQKQALIESDESIQALTPKSKKVLAALPLWMLKRRELIDTFKAFESKSVVYTGGYIGNSKITRINPPSQKYKGGSITFSSVDSRDMHGKKDTYDLVQFVDDIGKGRASLKRKS